MNPVDSEILALPLGPARVNWRRSRRARRVSLRIDPRGGAVVVTLPHKASRTAGVALLMDHAGWVSARLAALPGALPFVEGHRVPLHGIDHAIRHIGASRGTVSAHNGEILVAGDLEFLGRRVADFFRTEARRSLSEYVYEAAERAGLKPKRITVKDTRSRWGSCAANGNLAFSWRLVMAPPFVQQYVSAHEVAHLRFMHHGPEFWQLVGELTPHTDTACRWLRDHGARLFRIG